MVSCGCSITSCGDSCIQPEGGLGLDGVPRLKLMLTQMQLASAECDDSAAAVSYCQADFAAPEVTAALPMHPMQCPTAAGALLESYKGQGLTPAQTYAGALPCVAAVTDVRFRCFTALLHAL